MIHRDQWLVRQYELTKTSRSVLALAVLSSWRPMAWEAGNESVQSERRWGVILAGGDGTRLRPLTRFVCGDDRPKQFCPLYGGTTLLEQARRRAGRSLAADQVMFSLNRAHEEFYLRTLADCPSQRIVQPCNRGTAPAILSSLLVIAQNDPTASAAVFPSDHYYSDENVITEAVERAFDLAHAHPCSIILVGARPDCPEVEYGWIQIGAAARGRTDSFQVKAFVEKPSEPMARFLQEQDALWNTFVMVGTVLAFVETICSAMPGLLTRFRESPAWFTPQEETRLPDSLYARLPATDFSRHVLSLEAERLIVHRMGSVTWSDLGDCERASTVLSRYEMEPEWVKGWRGKTPCENVPALRKPPEHSDDRDSERIRFSVRRRSAL